MANFKYIGLGGLDEKGKNMNIFEIDGDIFVVDAGHKYPQSDELGVDLIIPNIEYLIKNKKRIKGIFITHAHEDQIGALPYIIDKLEVPIYVAEFSCKAVQIYLAKHKLKNVKIINIKKNRDFKIGDVEVRPFALTHSFPDHIGYAFKKGAEQVVIATDFIIDPQNKWKEYSSDFYRIGKIARHASTEMLLIETIGSAREGFVAPHHSIREYAREAIAKAEGRLIIGAYEQKIFQFKEMLEEAIKASRKIVVFGRTMQLFLDEMERTELITIPAHLKASSSEVNEIDNAVIFVTGSVDRIYPKLEKIANGEDENLQIKDTDSVLITAAPIPGAEVTFAKLLDDFYKVDIPVKGLRKKMTVSSHAGTEDIKAMIKMFNPKRVVGIKGEYRHQARFAEIAKEMSYDGKTILPTNGNVYEVNDGKIVLGSKKVEAGDTLVDGLGVGDIGAVVIKDRSTMANDGVIIMGYTIDKETKEIVAGPDIQMRGFMFIDKDSRALGDELLLIFKEELEAGKDSGAFDWNEIKDTIRRRTYKVISKKTGKKPIILPIILEV